MAKTIQGIQGHIAVDTGKHDQDATVALVVRQDNIAHAPVTVHLTPESADALLAAIAEARGAAAPAPTAPATPTAKKSG